MLVEEEVVFGDSSFNFLQEHLLLTCFKA